MQRLHDFGLSTFASAVVHDGHARLKRVNNHLGVRRVDSVVQTEEHINGADAVIRTHQLEFLVLRQVPQMNGAKLSEPYISADRHRVLCIVLSSLEARTELIRPAGAGQCRLDRLTSGSYDEYIQAGDGNFHARFCYCVIRLGVELWIRLLQEFICCGGGLNVRAMVDERPDPHTRGELRHAAKMIAVPVSRNQVVDLGESCVLDGGHDALRIPDSGCTGISGIDEHGFAGGRHEERGISALHVYDVDVQCRA
jgi:hypothetical protein